MKAIMVMYDSLRRDFLEPYGCDWTQTPNFRRLAEKAVTFDANYVGSMPCMPARRELHTGRYNFLHRSWGPLEPFDDSMPELLKQNGIYTHLVSDHKHYWEDGGATYHGRYNSWEIVRGQEGDCWKGDLNAAPTATAQGREQDSPLTRTMHTFDTINRSRIDSEEKMPQALTFQNGLDFIATNFEADNWFLQIETFDPHEPFFTQPQYRVLYPDSYIGKPSDWPRYGPVTEEDDFVDHVRNEYAALVTMCDTYLGKVLDSMDRYDLWKDTLLIVNTDHGFLLGDRRYWGKRGMPLWGEIAHTPLFLYDPRNPIQGERRSALTQTIDLPATLLDYYGVPYPKDMQGIPLRDVVANRCTKRKYALYGFFGGPLNITDGEYVYMRSPVDDCSELYEYTLMPSHMQRMFSPEELQDIRLTEQFSFTKGCRVMQIPASSKEGASDFGDRLYRLIDGKEEEIPHDAAIIGQMENLLRIALHENDCPPDLFKRYGLQ